MNTEEADFHLALGIQTHLGTALDVLDTLERDVARGNSILYSELSALRRALFKAQQKARTLERFFNDGK